jgi:energy-coupling factor transport system ATP-binding protein
VIRFEHVTITYPGAPHPALRDVDLHVAEGELTLVVGETGSGKTTLLRAVNGLVPHFTGGVLAGRVVVNGRDTRTHPPRELADVVGYVGQDPLSGFVTDTVEDELAYGMECIGLAPATMRRRVEETLDLLGLADLRDRPLLSLSAGQQQRVAIASVLTSSPRVLVLDEPTSALDPPAAEEVLAALTRLVHDLGLTVLIAEHRLERVVQYADQVLHVPGDGSVVAGEPAEVMSRSPVAPPVIELGRLAKWSPLPLSVRDARRAASALRAQLERLPIPAACRPLSGETVAMVEGAVVRYGDVVALRGVDLAFNAGQIVALMGRNGAGKSSLLTRLAGLRAPEGGRVRVAGHAPHELRPRELIRTVGLVPHNPGELLYCETVEAECREADRTLGLTQGATSALLARIAPDLPMSSHPHDLSEGQRLACALAVVLASAPPLLLLDEPTRGLDYPAKRRLGAVLRELSKDGTAVVMATHDVELVAEVANRTVILADGEVVADGPTREVVTSSPAFAPQVAKVLAPLPWLTVDDVRMGLAG